MMSVVPRSVSKTAGALLIALAMGLAGAAQARPVPLQGLSLVDHHGQRLGAAALDGRPVLLHFVFTTCSSTCPVQVHELGLMQRALPADVRQRLRIVSVTVDPLQDTPASLAAFAQRLGADQPGWYFVTGAASQVHALIDRMQALAPAAAQPEAHRNSLYLYDPRGALLQRYAGAPLDRARLVAEITQITRHSSP